MVMMRVTLKILKGFSLSWEQEIAKRDRAACLATGYSCRSQVKRIEGQTLKHPVQALLEIL